MNALREIRGIRTKVRREDDYRVYGVYRVPRRYTKDLADEREVTADIEVARADWPQWRAA